MKILKRIGILLLFLFSLFSALVILCAFRPDVTDAIAEFLYPDRHQTEITVAVDQNDLDTRYGAEAPYDAAEGQNQRRRMERHCGGGAGSGGPV